jgi:predicted NBD/HSP70 family sugar kinase
MMRLKRASRTELGRAASMSLATTGRIVESLVSEGILVSAKSADDNVVQTSKRMRGRQMELLELDPQHRRVFAIHLGVPETVVSRLPLALPEKDAWEASFKTPENAEEWCEKMNALWKQMSISSLEAAVVSLPGIVDEAKGLVLLSPNQRWLEKVDFNLVLKQILPLPFVCVQEIKALAFGQIALTPQTGDYLLVDFGTGVGAVAVSNGQLYSGPLPLCCELGHTPVPGNVRRCGCGSIGCLETLASRIGMRASAREDGWPDRWDELVAQVNKQGIPQWLARTLDATAIAIAGVLNAMGFRQVLVTGAMSELPAEVHDYLFKGISAAAVWARFGTIECHAVPRHRMVGIASVAVNHLLLDE